MENAFILSPYYIDKPVDALKRFTQPDWQLNSVELTGDDAQAKASCAHKGLADKVEAALKAGKRPISIAGDCCATIPVMAGLQRAGLSPTFLWLDSHGDFNTWETSPSGFLGGMPLAMIAGLGELRMNDAVGLKPIPQENIILADGRDLDKGERILVENSSITHIESFKAIKQHDFKGPVYIHFDVDVLHLEDIPAVNYPAKGGPRAAEVADVFKFLKENVEIIALSSTIGVWSEEGDQAKKCDKVAWDLLELLF